jgi:hypothetical protein
MLFTQGALPEQDVMELSLELFNQIIRQLRSEDKTTRDKRLEPRVGLGGEVAMVNGVGGTRRLATVRVRDISRTGIGLHCSRAMEPGETFVLQLNTDNDAHVWMMCVAAYCRAVTPGQYSVGAHIKHVLNAQQIADAEADRKRATAMEKIASAILG